MASNVVDQSEQAFDTHRRLRKAEQQAERAEVRLAALEKRVRMTEAALGEEAADHLAIEIERLVEAIVDRRFDAVAADTARQISAAEKRDEVERALLRGELHALIEPRMPQGDWQAGRRYPHAATVRHAGSIWMCCTRNGSDEEPGDGARDWIATLSGFTGAEIVRTGERELRLELRGAAGMTVSTSVASGEWIFRGVWEERTYVRGDVVVRGGSSWVCVWDATFGRPGDCSSWKIIAQRGKTGGPTPEQVLSIRRGAARDLAQAIGDDRSGEIALGIGRVVERHLQIVEASKLADHRDRQDALRRLAQTEIGARIDRLVGGRTEVADDLATRVADGALATAALLIRDPAEGFRAAASALLACSYATADSDLREAEAARMRAPAPAADLAERVYRNSFAILVGDNTLAAVA